MCSELFLGYPQYHQDPRGDKENAFFWDDAAVPGCSRTSLQYSRSLGYQPTLIGYLPQAARRIHASRSTRCTVASA